MQFTRLRLSGFKSFVEPCELRIEPGLTGVVGPNGCGKSNLLEALRWVMGEGSPKSLRGGAMEDVIFAGTARRQAREIADVLLTLDNSDRRAPAALNDDDVIEVLRRIERGAGSAYRVNGRDVRQRDIQLLFADAATGAHSPALVSQGRIGQVIAAKPVERRVLLEEAAGISGLHVRRHEAELRLRATEANLLRLDDLLGGMATQAAALRRAAKTADRYRTLSDQIRAAEAQLLFARWSAAMAAAAAARRDAAAAEATVAELTRAAAQLATGQADAAAGLPDLRAAEAAAAATLQHLRQQAAALASELERVDARRRELAAAAATIARDRAREAGLASDAAAAVARLTEEAAALDAAQAAAAAARPDAAARTVAAEAAGARADRAHASAVEAQARAKAEAAALRNAASTAAAAAARAAADAARAVAELDALGDGTAVAARVDMAACALADAAAAVDTAARAVDAADAARIAAAAARDTANAALLTARGSGGERGIIAQLRVAPGFEAAVAAALGTDLDAPVGGGKGRFWAGTDSGADDLPLPAGVEPLAAHVTGPPELARRLRQIGFAPDEAAAEAFATQLRPGQRLVTATGRLWRWDGFRAFGGEGAATAEQLRQRARLAGIEADLPDAAARLTAATASYAGAEAAALRSVDADRRARAERVAAERAADAARTAHSAAQTAQAQFAARVAALAETVRRSQGEAERCAAEATAAAAAAAAAPDAERLAEAAAAARGAADAARAELAAARVAEASLDRERAAGAARRTALAAERDGWTRRAQAGAEQTEELGRRDAAIAAERAAIDARPAAIAAKQARLATLVTDAEAARRTAADTLVAAEAALRRLDASAREVADRLGHAREARARAAATAEHAGGQAREIEARCGERFATAPPRLPDAHGFAHDGDADDAALAAMLDALSADRERLGPVNLLAASELAALEATVTATTTERDELQTAIARLRGAIGALNREGRARLLAAFETVDAHFRALFGTLFAGGAAHLALIEAEDPLTAGLEIMAQPPGKKLQSLTLLSGGEQALTAIALIFALFLTTPAPICVLDEVDAPLDDANVERFCDLLDHMAETTRTRFLIVTHNAVTMSRMHRLFGVTMAEPGVSQLVSVDLARAEALLAAE